MLKEKSNLLSKHQIRLSCEVLIVRQRKITTKK